MNYLLLELDEVLSVRELDDELELLLDELCVELLRPELLFEGDEYVFLLDDELFLSTVGVVRGVDFL